MDAEGLLERRPLRVAINAQLRPGGESGGVEQFVFGLVRSVGRLDGPEDYVIVAHRDAPDWLAKEIGPNQRIVVGPAPVGSAARLRRKLTGESPLASTGFFESLGVDLVHFPYQSYERVALPTIYNPHDLQHRHYPEFFGPKQLAWRELVQSTGCREATMVATESEWARADTIAQYGLDPAKVIAIPRGAPTALYEAEPDAADVRRRFELPELFALYPARTWPHKNHLRLIEALALAQERGGLELSLVFTGKATEHDDVVRTRAGELGVGERVRFLGFVAPEELRALYRLARFVIVPSLFEGGGFPLLEAFGERTPVACSNVTALPEVGGDAVFLFDPHSLEEIAAALRRLAEEPLLQDKFGQRGSARIRSFDWRRTALAYRNLYGSIAASDVAISRGRGRPQESRSASRRPAT